MADCARTLERCSRTWRPQGEPHRGWAFDARSRAYDDREPPKYSASQVVGYIKGKSAPIDEVVNMVAVGHRLMAAPGSMDVTGLVALMAVLRRAAVWIVFRHLDDVGLAVTSPK